MATIECDFCDVNEASLILTNLENGDVTRVCGACFPGFVLTLAEAIAGSAEPVVDELATEFPDFDQALGGDQAAGLNPGDPDTYTPDPKPNGRSRKPSAEVVTDTETENNGDQADDDNATIES